MTNPEPIESPDSAPPAPVLELVPATNEPWFSEEASVAIEAYAVQLRLAPSPEVKEKAFVGLLKETEENLYGLALSITHDSTLAEQVVEDTYVRVWRFIDNFESRSAVTTWMHRILTNCARTRLHARNHPKEVPFSYTDRSVLKGDSGGNEGKHPNENNIIDRWADGQPESVALRRELMDEVATALRQLTTNSAAAIVLKDIIGLSHEEIADKLGISVGASKVRLLRARLLIRPFLAEYCEDWSIASDTQNQ